jgi:hypothetical protein
VRREAEWSGERSMAVAERGENGLLLRADSERRRRTGRRLHALRMERTWRPVDSTDVRWWQWSSSCCVRAMPATGRRLSSA